jgi:hypothetical protein
MSSLARRAFRAVLIVTLFPSYACVHAAPIDEAPSMMMSATTSQTFQWRRLHGNGQYISDEVLYAERLTPLPTLLRTHLLGFQMPASALAAGPAKRMTCTTLVYLDGLYEPGALESGIDTKDLSGVEYYSAATAPTQFRRAGNACPILLLWVRH